MSTRIAIHVGTELAQKAAQLFQRLEQLLELDRSVSVLIAGGMAMHFYVPARLTNDIDAEFGARIFIPQDLAEPPDDGCTPVWIDKGYNPRFSMLHEKRAEDAVSIDLGTRMFRISVLSPLDLAASKIVRFSDLDRSDIAALGERGLVSPDALRQRADEALRGVLGDTSEIKRNIARAVELLRSSPSRNEKPGL